MKTAACDWSKMEDIDLVSTEVVLSVHYFLIILSTGQSSVLPEFVFKTNSHFCALPQSSEIIFIFLHFLKVYWAANLISVSEKTKNGGNVSNMWVIVITVNFWSMWGNVSTPVNQKPLYSNWAINMEHFYSVCASHRVLIGILGSMQAQPVSQQEIAPQFAH